MRITVITAAFFALLLPMNGEKPYSFETTPGKLPKHVVPLEYAIRIVPNLEKLTFADSETVKVKISAPARELVRCTPVRRRA